MGAAGLRTVLAGVGAFAALLVVTGFASQPAASPVIVGHLVGAVDPVTAGYLHRVMGTAEQEHAALVVLTIDTPGGLDSSMREMVQDLLASDVPSVVFVWPSGARDASAGVFISQAAGLVAMAPDTNIGAAHPVGGGGETITGDLGDKITNDAAAYIAGLAKQHGRNDTWAQDAVRNSVSLDAQQAVDQHVADLLAPDLPTLLTMVEGRSVPVAAGETVTIHAAGAPVETVDMQPVELLLQKLFDPNIAYLLLTIGFYALLIGAAGVAQSALDPDGTVRLAGQLWSAHADGPSVGVGEPVRVISRHGLTLHVEPMDR